MHTGYRLGAAAMVVLIGAATAAPARWTFEADEVGKPAKGFTTEVGRWEVAQDGGDRVLAQRAENGNRVYNMAFVDGTSYKDLDISVRVKPQTGTLDQGGGMVWRAKDQDHYYVARWNPLEDNLRLYKVENGRRTQLDHADAAGDRGWHTLRITMKDRDITGWLDGRKLLVAEDSTFPDAGKVGVWSKSDAQSYFDDLKVEALPEGEDAK
jgi:hypothetical protein